MERTCKRVRRAADPRLEVGRGHNCACQQNPWIAQYRNSRKLWQIQGLGLGRTQNEGGSNLETQKLSVCFMGQGTKALSPQIRWRIKCPPLKSPVCLVTALDEQSGIKQRNATSSRSRARPANRFRAFEASTFNPRSTHSKCSPLFPSRCAGRVPDTSTTTSRAKPLRFRAKSLRPGSHRTRRASQVGFTQDASEVRSAVTSSVHTRAACIAACDDQVHVQCVKNCVRCVAITLHTDATPDASGVDDASVFCSRTDEAFPAP